MECLWFTFFVFAIPACWALGKWILTVQLPTIPKKVRLSPKRPAYVAPPTREERLATAQQTYEKRLRVLSAASLDDIELKTAQEKAKQQYLRELDEVMR